MKQSIFLLLLCALFATIGCRNTEGTHKIYGTSMSDQVNQAFEQLSLGSEVEAKLDTVLGSVTIKLFSGPCETKVVETEGETGSGMTVKRFISINECTEVAEQLKAGYVFVPVTDQRSGRPVWVPLPALLKTEQPAEAEILNLQVREIYLTSDGQSPTKLLVQI
jgi:hypothetical protein